MSWLVCLVIFSVFSAAASMQQGIKGSEHEASVEVQGGLQASKMSAEGAQLEQEIEDAEEDEGESCTAVKSYEQIFQHIGKSKVCNLMNRESDWMAIIRQGGTSRSELLLSTESRRREPQGCVHPGLAHGSTYCLSVQVIMGEKTNSAESQEKLCTCFANLLNNCHGQDLGCIDDQICNCPGICPDFKKNEMKCPETTMRRTRAGGRTATRAGGRIRRLYTSSSSSTSTGNLTQVMLRRGMVSHSSSGQVELEVDGNGDIKRQSLDSSVDSSVTAKCHD